MDSTHKAILFSQADLSGKALVLFQTTELADITGWLGEVRATLVVKGLWWASWSNGGTGFSPHPHGGVYNGNLADYRNLFSDQPASQVRKMATGEVVTRPRRETEKSRTVDGPQTYQMCFYTQNIAFSIDPAPPYKFKIVDDKESFRWLVADGDTVAIEWTGQIGTGHPWLEFTQRALKPGESPATFPPLKLSDDVEVDSANMRVILKRNGSQFEIKRENGIKWSINFCWLDEHGHVHKIDPEMQVGPGSSVNG